MALESFPPLALVAIRFTVSGSLMLAAAYFMGAQCRKAASCRTTALTGVLVLGGANTALVISETWIPSGLASLFVAVSPFWLVGVEAVVPGGGRLSRATVLGLFSV